MIKRILLALDPSPYSETAIEYACHIAKMHNAEINGLVVLDIPGIAESIGPVPLGASHYAKQLTESKKKEADQRITALLNHFRDTCVKNGVSHRESKRQGSPSRAIIEESVYYDLVVMGLKTFFEFESESEDSGRSIAEFMDHSVTPILAVPKSPSPEFFDHEFNVLMAFDGSLPSARCLHSLSQMYKEQPDNLILLSSDSNEAESKKRLSEAEMYLNAHGIYNVTKVHTSAHIKDAIAEQSKKEIDVIALGAHAKKSIFDFRLGSIARWLIEHSEKPLLIGH